MDQAKLKEILAAHAAWLRGEEGGIRADLQGADLQGAYLRNADLQGVYLRDADLRDATLPHFQIVPSEGAFIGWKKASGKVLKVEIPAEARRTSSLIGRKCRAEFVRVLEIEDDDGGAVAGDHDSSTVYITGEITRADSFDDDIRAECTHGIHFFLTREEAQEY